MNNLFVLSGGGAKGAFQAGVLKQLENNGIIPDAIIGTSVGAVNGLVYSYLGGNGLDKMWNDLSSSSEVLYPSKLEWLFAFHRLFFSDGIYSLKKVKKHLKKELKGKVASCEFIPCCVNLKSGELTYPRLSYLSFDELIEYVIASCSIPLLIESNKGSVDGGVREHTPIRKALEFKPKKIYVIVCRPIPLEPIKKEMKIFPWYRVLQRSTDDIMSHEIFLNDLKVIQENKNKYDIELYLPDRMWSESSLTFDKDKIKNAFRAGLNCIKTDLKTLDTLF